MRMHYVLLAGLILMTAGQPINAAPARVLRQAQDGLRQAQDDLRQAQDDLRQAHDDLRQARNDGGTRLVIIAPHRFHSALADFVKHKQKQMPVRLCALEDVLRDWKGADDPERVKRFLYSEWRHRRLGYALLVGDADVFPVRYMTLDRITPEAFDYAFYPSDLYYSDLAKQDGSFDDWNAQKEGYHAGYIGEVQGEKHKTPPINFDDIDYRPDIAVGRWPVSTPAEVKLVASKSIAYENGVSKASAPGIRKAAFFAVGGWVDSRQAMDEMASNLPAGWTAQRRFYTDEPNAQKALLPTSEELARILNEGVSLVVHAGHGSDNTWEGCFSTKMLPGIKNADRLPVMLSVGCSTARFATLPPYEAYVDVSGIAHKGSNNGEVFTSPPPPPATHQSGECNPTGLGEQLVRGGANGAVAYIGCDTGSQPCGVALATGFVDALAKAKHPRLGDCWAEAVSYYYDNQKLATIQPDSGWYPPSIFFQAMKFMLYGDPSLLMPAPTR